jgi:hypothetical protein
MEKDKQKGFIGLIIVLIFALSLAKYFFDWSAVDFLKSPKLLEVLIYIKKFVLIVWKTILVTPATFIWNEVVVGIIWKTIVASYDLLRHWVDSKS